MNERLEHLLGKWQGDWGAEKGIEDFLLLQAILNPGSIDPNLLPLLLLAGGGPRHGRRFERLALFLMLSQQTAASTAATAGTTGTTPTMSTNPMLLMLALGLFGSEGREAFFAMREEEEAEEHAGKHH
jgi:hypothetical protein